MLNRIMRLLHIKKKGDLTEQEIEFLPAAIEVLETPPSPAGRLVMWTLFILIIATAIWSFVGKIDEVAVAPGKIVPTGRVKTIQTENGGVVTDIYVTEGQSVKKGDLLLVLNSEVSDAELQKFRETVDHYRLSIACSDAMLRGGSFKPKLSDYKSLVQEDMDKQVAYYNSKMVAYRAKVDLATAELGAQKASYNAETANRDKLVQLLEVARDQERRMDELLENDKAVSLFMVLEYRNKRVTLQEDLEAQKANIARASAGIAQYRSKAESVRDDFISEVTTAIVSDNRNLDAAQKELLKAEYREKDAKIIAPVDGRVAQLAVYTVGGVLKASQIIMMVVPEDVTLEVEAWLSNKDIGFVSPGQNAEVKIDTFSFQKYGIINATVKNVSPDATEREYKEGEGAVEDKKMSYRVILSLERSTMNVNGKEVQLSPGMVATAEVKIKQKRIIDFFLDPFKQYVYDAMKER